MRVTSVPGPHDIGGLGGGARVFVNFLADAEQSMWQFCPLGPTKPAMANSSYQSTSSFVGSSFLISLTDLIARGWLTDTDLGPIPDFGPLAIGYKRVGEYRRSRLRTILDRFEAEATEDDRAILDAFREHEASWLDDCALFAALKDESRRTWIDWPTGSRTHGPDTLADARTEYADEIRYHGFIQFCFNKQWRALTDYADKKDITLVGDLPTYVALDSADVWAAPEAFDLTESGEPAAVTGVPPNPDDAGQRQGNPLYDWETLREDGYGWWLDHLRRLFDLVDMTRIGHFRGFDKFWVIDTDSNDSGDGEWRDAPGHDFFETAEHELDDLPFAVEDFGFLDVLLADLRDRFAFPGMCVPQYTDWYREGDIYQPMHYPESSVAYTSTHDTDTPVGYHRDLDDHTRDCLHYNISTDGSEIHWFIIDAIWNSASVLAFMTTQDFLGPGSDARFNIPGTQTGNWEWRVTREGLDDGVADRLASLANLHIRN